MDYTIAIQSFHVLLKRSDSHLKKRKRNLHPMVRRSSSQANQNKGTIGISDLQPFTTNYCSQPGDIWFRNYDHRVMEDRFISPLTKQSVLIILYGSGMDTDMVKLRIWVWLETSHQSLSNYPVLANTLFLPWWRSEWRMKQECHEERVRTQASTLPLSLSLSLTILLRWWDHLLNVRRVISTSG